jgi:hypothetical protein
MAEVWSKHRLVPWEVEVSDPLTYHNRGAIARWAEDRGVSIGVPGGVEDPEMTVLLVTTRTGIRDAYLADRLVYDGFHIDVIDHAHYKLWYEPVGSLDEPVSPG